MLLLELKSISRKDSYRIPLIREPLRNPLRFDTYDLECYIRGRIIFRIDDTDILNPNLAWEVLFLATNFTNSEYFLDPLAAGKYTTLEIPEGHGELLFKRTGEDVEVGARGERHTGTADYTELLNRSRRFAEDVRTTLLAMNPKFAEHRGLGEWFRTPLVEPQDQ